MSIQFLLKFGKFQHLKQLLSFGQIYIKQAEFFKQDIPHDRFDRTEGKLSIEHVADTFIEVRPSGTTDWKKLNVKTGVFEQSLKLDHRYIYSLFSILEIETRQNEFFEFSDDIKKMGDSYLLINNPREFMNRLLTTLDQGGYCYSHGIIEYYVPSGNHKKLGLFHKQSNYQYQKEYRIVIELNPDNNIQPPEHIKFEIGNLEDIAEICSIDQHKGLQFRWK